MHIPALTITKQEGDCFQEPESNNGARFNNLCFGFTVAYFEIIIIRVFLGAPRSLARPLLNDTRSTVSSSAILTTERCSSKQSARAASALWGAVAGSGLGFQNMVGVS